MSSSDSTAEPAAPQATTHLAPSRRAGFVLSHLCRDFFQSYYRHQHGRPIGDAEILELVNSAHDRAIAGGHVYRCVKEMQFSYPRVMLHPRYEQLIQHNSAVAGLRVLDVGSCMGSDLRQMILHGVKPVHALGLELEQDLIDLGLDVLYQDRAALHNSFITQNVLSDDFLSHRQLANFHAAGIDVIYCGSVYHLLEEAPTHTLSQHLYRLLKPGGILIGRTVGSLHPTAPIAANWNGRPRFLHSADTFIRTLLQYGFVDVEFVVTDSDVGRLDGGGGMDGRGDDFVHGDGGGDGDGERKAATAMHAFYARKAHT